ncbi:MAG TPA: hypothetical protein VGS07_29810 [Thermoanaerobaculia bacterium]|jgi:hypothetical protein|nr:hypothetical protein [Thermoanaerobaculia bacterium]
MQMRNRFISFVAIAIVLPIIANCACRPPTATIGWDSGELQTQTGDKNSNKKKLVMRVYYSYAQQRNGSYDWDVQYSMKAEDHNQSGSGWHQVNQLYSFRFNAVFELPAGTATINKSRDLTGVASPHGELLVHYNTAALPVFKSKTATGSRSGGPSGLSITWP